MLPETYAVICVPLAAKGTSRLPACAQLCGGRTTAVVADDDEVQLDAEDGFARTTRCAGANSVFATRWVCRWEGSRASACGRCSGR